MRHHARKLPRHWITTHDNRANLRICAPLSIIAALCACTCRATRAPRCSVPSRSSLTEIEGADVLYHAEGIIRESKENAAALFGTKKTVYSAEGSSLCIRAMLYLALLHARANHKKPVIAAGRNAHKVFMTAAALLDLDIRWIYGTESVIFLAIARAARRRAHIRKTLPPCTSQARIISAISRTSSPCPPSVKNTAYYCLSITPTARTCVSAAPMHPCSSARTSVIPRTKRCRS